MMAPVLSQPSMPLPLGAKRKAGLHVSPEELAHVKDRCALVDIEMKGVNQRGELSSPGFATVMLPSRDITTRIPLHGAVCDLELPPIR